MLGGIALKGDAGAGGHGTEGGCLCWGGIALKGDHSIILLLYRKRCSRMMLTSRT